MSIIKSNFIKIAKMADIGFSKSENFKAQSGALGPHALLCQISSKAVNSCRDMAIFRFFKMAAICHLPFQIVEILMADWLWWSQMHHCFKFYKNRSNGCRDMVIIRFFQEGRRLPSQIYGVHFGTPTKSTWRSYHWTNFGWNSFISFYNMKI